MQTGIYCIRHISSSKIYIGSAIKIAVRWSRHKTELNNNKHCNRLLQRAWNKYGETAFEFSILELCNKETLKEREQNWLDGLQSFKAERGYNLSPTARNSLGVRHTEETRENMSRAKRKMTNETKAKLSAFRKGKKHTEEHKLKMSLSKKGHILSAETKEKISKAHKGRKLSTEQKIKIEASKRARSPWPHPDGQKCQCIECKEAFRKRRRLWERRKVGLKRGYILGEGIFTS